MKRMQKVLAMLLAVIMLVSQANVAWATEITVEEAVVVNTDAEESAPEEKVEGSIEEQKDNDKESGEETEVLPVALSEEAEEIVADAADSAVEAENESADIVNDTMETEDESIVAAESTDAMPEEISEEEISEEESEEPEEAEVKTHFYYEDSRVKVTAIAQKEANLPENAVLKAIYLSEGSSAYRSAVEAVTEQMETKKREFLDFVCYDVFFEADGVEIEPEEGTVKVTMSYKQPQFTEVADEATEYATYHIVDGTNEVENVTGTVDTNKAGAVTEMAFSTESFSVIVGAAIKVKIEEGHRIKYSDYGVLNSGEPGVTYTNYFYIEHEDKKQLAYCLQSLWGNPDSEEDATDGVVELNDGNQSLQKILYYGYGGPDDVSEEFFTADRMANYKGIKNWNTDDFRYLITHATASYAYFEHYKSYEEIIGSYLSSLQAATWGMTSAGKQLVMDYYNWLVQKSLPDTMHVNDSVTGDGLTGDAFVMNGRTDTEVKIGITFTVPEGWIYKSEGESFPGVQKVTAYRQQEFTFSLSDSMQKLNPSDVPKMSVEGVVNGSPDESWKAVITKGSKGNLYQQDLGGISYSKLATADTKTSFNVTAQKGSLSIQKTDEEGNALAGAKFCLYYDAACERPLVDGLEADPLVTDGNGRINVSFLITDTIEKTQKIYVKEIEAPAGYCLNSDVVTVSLKDGKGSVSLENEKVSGTLKIYKTGEALAGAADDDSCFKYEVSPLAGAEFALYAKDDLDKAVAVLVTDDAGYAQAAGIALGEYILKETKAPEGYLLDTTEYEVIFAQGNQLDKEVVVAKELLNERYTFDIIVEKISSEELGYPVSGAKFGLYAAEDIKCGQDVVSADTLIDTAISDKDGIAAFAADVPMGRYYVKELVAPMGFTVSDKVINIDLTAPDSTDKSIECRYEFTEDALQILVEKLDDEGKPVMNAEMELRALEDIYDAEGNLVYAKGTVIEAWKSMGIPVEIGSKIITGASYEIAETKAPAGYAYAKSVTFSVLPDGSIECDGEVLDNGVIVLRDKRFELCIAKVEEEDHSKSVKGAELTLYGQDENGEYTVVVHKWVTEDGEIHDVSGYMYAGCKYMLRETKAPEGYEYADDIFFEITLDGDVISDAETMTMEDGSVVYLMEDVKIVDPVVKEKDEPDTSVKTGDNNSVTLWLMTMLMAALVIAESFRKRCINR